MAIDVNKLTFFNKDVLEDKGLNDWVLDNSTQSSDYIQIGKDGSIKKIVLNDTLIKACKYLKLVFTININNSVIDTDNLYGNNINCNIKEKYMIGSNEYIKRNKVNMYYDKSTEEDVGDNYYKVTKIIEMTNINLNYFYIDISNNSDYVVKIKDVKVYRSQDIETSQYQDVAVESSNQYGTFIEARTDDPVNANIGRIWLRIDL